MTPRTSPRAPDCAPLLRWLVPVLLLLTPWLASAATLSITIEGLKPDLEEAVRANLTLQNYGGRDVTAAQIRRLFNAAEKEIGAALEPYGYYHSEVASSLQTTPKGLNAVFRVTLGEPVKVNRKSVAVSGEGAQMRPVERAIRRFKPAEGEPLDHGVYEASKEAIEQALLNSGYLRLKATKHEVKVSRNENTADIDVAWESGPRMRFGEVHFSDAQFPPEFLARYIPWKPGDYYSPEQLLALQQRLVDADYFATVVAQPDLSHTDSIDVPINVSLSPAKRTIYTAKAYVSTDTGPGIGVGMQRRWINDSGHKFGADIDYAQRQKAATTNYLIPLPGPNDKNFNFGITYRDIDTLSSQSRTERIAANESQKWRGFTRTLGLQYLAGTFKIADENGYSKLFFAEATLTRKQANDFFFPRRGYSLGFAVRASPENALTDTSFTQATADGKYIRPLGRKQRLILRTSLGAMAVKDFNQLPPELRFFAGGDRSIRGFDYQQLGTTNAAGKVIGGTYLTVGSVELERYFLPKWGGAVWVDGGDAFRQGEFALNVGAGVGVRWRSPVGVVRVDVGKPVKSELSQKIHFHVSIGPDL